MAPGKYHYFVRLQDNPVALYEGSVPGFRATASEKVNGKLNMRSEAVVQYRDYLTQRQSSVLAQASKVIDSDAVKQRTTLAFNGLVVEMTQAQAEKFAKISGVAHIKREELRYPTTDAGPSAHQSTFCMGRNSNRNGK